MSDRTGQSVRRVERTDDPASTEQQQIPRTCRSDIRTSVLHYQGRRFDRHDEYRRGAFGTIRLPEWKAESIDLHKIHVFAVLWPASADQRMNGADRVGNKCEQCSH